MAIGTNPLVVLRATKMLLTPLESRDLIGAYKPDNLEEAIVRLLMIIDSASRVARPFFLARRARGPQEKKRVWPRIDNTRPMDWKQISAPGHIPVSRLFYNGGSE